MPLDAKTLRAWFASEGFRANGRGYEQALEGVPHDLADWAEAAGLADALRECAVACYRRFPCADAQTPLSADGSARLGRGHQRLVATIRAAGFEPRVLSGYRSPRYQSLLFAARLLDGTLFDQRDRFTCLPPDQSQHTKADCAIDIDNAEDLTFFLGSSRVRLPCSMFRPYLEHPRIAHEPWHWTTIFHESDVEAELAIPRRSRHQSVEGLAQFLFDQPPIGADHPPAGHVFVQGWSGDGTSKCIGSLRRNIAASVADASSAVSALEPTVRLATVPVGFTPQMDGRLQPCDPGVCLVRISGDAGQAYLTPFASIAERINTPDLVLHTLQDKARMRAGDVYFLEKSLADEWLIHRDNLVLQVEHGAARSGFYREIDAAALLIARLHAWLEETDDGVFPAYRLQRFAAPDFDWSLVHMGLLYFYLSEVCDPAHEMLRLRMRALLFQDLERGGEWFADADSASAAVFLIRGDLLRDTKGALRLLSDWWPHLREWYSQDVSANSRFMLGNLCGLLADRAVPASGITRGAEIGIDVEAALSWTRESMLYALASAQVVRHLIDLNACAPSQATRALESILEHPQGCGIGEAGSFEGIETFQSALPIEAIGELSVVVDTSAEERAALLERARLASTFLARCQFDEGAGVTPGLGWRSVGAVTYSLLDRHVRADYGIHAARAGRVVKMLEQLAAQRT